jgi:predicted short-subunit dehydrogenase-like oxidoreductase (DUF2520 family)
MASTSPPRPQLPDPLAPEDPNPNAPDFDDEAGIDALVDDLAAAVPTDRKGVAALEGALSYLSERLDPDGAAVLGAALDEIATRHVVVLRAVARSVASLQAERRHPLFELSPSEVTHALEGT